MVLEVNLIDEKYWEILGRQTVTYDKWRWMGGMLIQGTVQGAMRLQDGEGYHRDSDAWPDFRDPATFGCLLVLTREAWGVNEWRRLTVEPAGDSWCIVLRNGRHRPPSRSIPAWDLDTSITPRYRGVKGALGENFFPTEAEALAKALGKSCRNYIQENP